MIIDTHFYISVILILSIKMQTNMQPLIGDMI